jgi:exopolysaccharide production protein ExoY
MLIKIIAAVLLVFCSPLLFLVGGIIKIKSKGPFFYRQTREGKNGKQFKIWKLRTMITNADLKLNEILKNNVELSKEWEEFGCLKNDPRIAGKGARFARQFSIDELPQLWNVCKGEMVFIGPRPLETKLVETLNSEDRNLRASVTPGITGLWQVGQRSSSTIRQMQRYDRLYIRKKNVLMDLYIIIQTLKVVFKGTGI